MQKTGVDPVNTISDSLKTLDAINCAFLQQQYFDIRRLSY